MEKEERIFIYISKDKNGIKFLLLNKNCLNNGNKAEGVFVNYQKLKVAKVNAGAIFKMQSTENGEHITHSNPLYAYDWWKNTEDRIKWQVEQKQKEDKLVMDKLVKTDDLEKLLIPTAKKIRTCNTRQERAIILARVIDYLTYY